MNDKLTEVTAGTVHSISIYFIVICHKHELWGPGNTHANSLNELNHTFYNKC